MSTTLRPALTPTELRFLRTVPEDTEDAPWMVMNNGQFFGASGLAWSLRSYARRRQLPWHVGGMLPLYYPATDRRGRQRQKAVAPDVFVAWVPLEGRSSLDITQEGMPPFVLEVVSPSSVEHDLSNKTEIYRLLGVEEYAIVRLDLTPMRLEGYRRGTDGEWEAWAPDGQGRLWSGVLGLWLVVEGETLRAQTVTGEVLLTPEEESEARAQEAAARAEAEAEAAELRRLVERLRQEGTNR